MTNDSELNSSIPLTTSDLLAMLTGQREAAASEDPSMYRYVIYARKSTTGEEKQVKSLGDQVQECKDWAKRNNLAVAGEPIMEAMSAKEPGIRPKFAAMINDIRAGKYDGILAWHPDRLARNMKDAGEVIDLLDKHIIKNLQFVSYAFTNDPPGKMMLGILFVLSKQYSDQLSVNVKRGTKRRIQEGVILGDGKHGYYMDANKKLRPDGKNFILMQAAWEKRVQGQTLEVIAEFLNQQGYERSTIIGGTHHKLFTMSAKRLGAVFTDATYAGVYRFGEQFSNLTQSNSDFEPMITPDDYMAVNKGVKPKPSLVGRKATLLNHKVVCGECGNPLNAGITSKPKQGRKYFYYRCITSKCVMFNRSVRAKAVVDYAVDYLRHVKFDTQAMYVSYNGEMQRLVKTEGVSLANAQTSLVKRLSDLETSIANVTSYLAKEENGGDPGLVRHFSEDLKSKLANKVSLEQQIKTVKQQIMRNKSATHAYDEFLELLHNLPDTIAKTKKLEVLDYYLSKIFSNLMVKDGKVLSCQLNQPFASFVKEALATQGGEYRGRTC